MSRTLRHDNACVAREIEFALLRTREYRDQLAWDLEKLKARGARKDAALRAYDVAFFENCIEGLEVMLEKFARLIAMEEAFEAEVARMVGRAELIARSRVDTAAPARTGRRRKGISAFERADQSRDAISAFERALAETESPLYVGRALKRADQSRDAISAFEWAFAETGNPLYVWHALSMLCVPSIPGGNTDDRLLPSWCVDYLSDTAEALLGLQPPRVQSEGGITELARAVSNAVGLTRQGWTAYGRWRTDRDRVGEAALYARVKALGIPDKDAMEAAVEVLGLEADRSVRRRLHRARRVKPKPTEPAP